MRRMTGSCAIQASRLLQAASGRAGGRAGEKNERQSERQSEGSGGSDAGEAKGLKATATGG
jgi:hypothetical protein